MSMNNEKETKRILDDLFIGNERLRQEVEAYIAGNSYNTEVELLADVKRYLKARLISPGIIDDRRYSERMKKNYGLYETAGSFIFNVLDKKHRDALVVIYELEDDDGNIDVDIDDAYALSMEAITVMRELLNE